MAQQEFSRKGAKVARRKEEQIGLDFASLPPLRLCVNLLFAVPPRCEI
jgi:hypothetical protein